MPAKYVLAIDQGTTSTRALLFDQQLRVAAAAALELTQHYPRPGWVEHDPDEIWATVARTVRGALRRAGAKGKDLAAIGITNQRETTLLFDRVTGRCTHRAIVWQDRRTTPICDRLRRHEPAIQRRSGLLVDPYFSGTKMRWLLEHGPHRRRRLSRLALGTVDTFLVHRLTHGRALVTDVTNASRTMLMDLRQGTWDDQLSHLLNVPIGMLPRIVASSQVVGETAGLPFLPDGIPIAGIAGDQQASLYGQGGFTAGTAKCTYGTGAFLLVATGTNPVRSRHRILTTAAATAHRPRRYALEGSVFISGAAVQWLRDGLQLIKSAQETETLARSVPSSDGLAFVPALTGLGAPYWRSDARGAIFGITRGTTRAHLARATLEGMAFQVADVLAAINRDRRKRCPSMFVDGGGSANDFLMQFQADVLSARLVRLQNQEATAAGAAMLAGLAVGFWKSESQLKKLLRVDREFRPRMAAKRRKEALTQWHRAVAHLIKGS